MPMTASPRAEMRMLVGYVLLAPMCGLLAYLTVVGQLALGVWSFNGPPSSQAAVPMAFAVMLFAAPIATIAGAVPGVAWLIRRGLLTLPNLLLTGVVIGNIPIAILAVLALLEQLGKGATLATVRWSPLTPWLMGAWFGAWGALFFWFVSIRGTPLDVRASSIAPAPAPRT